MMLRCVERTSISHGLVTQIYIYRYSHFNLSIFSQRSSSKMVYDSNMAISENGNIRRHPDLRNYQQTSNEETGER